MLFDMHVYSGGIHSYHTYECVWWQDDVEYAEDKSAWSRAGSEVLNSNMAAGTFRCVSVRLHFDA